MPGYTSTYDKIDMQRRAGFAMYYSEVEEKLRGAILVRHEMTPGVRTPSTDWASDAIRAAKATPRGRRLVLAIKRDLGIPIVVRVPRRLVSPIVSVPVSRAVPRPVPAIMRRRRKAFLSAV